MTDTAVRPFLENAIMSVARWSLLALVLIAAPASAGDWIHWRGPEQTGFSREVGLPDSFSVTEVGKDNLLWRSNIGGRSAPLILNGKLYLISASGTGPTEGERVVCLDATTGKLEWEKKFNVFHTDIVSSRLGWTSLTADPKAGVVFTHGTQGNISAFDAKTGDVKWTRNLTEEFGRVTGYGGRISSPIFDSGLVIVGIVNSSWGPHARGGNRYVAFDAKSGDVSWWQEVSSPTRPILGTYYSNPVISVINGQRLLITGGADGAVHAMKVRTGELVWSYPFAKGVVNASPVLDGNLVYISHGEENLGGGPLGKAICLDASKVDAKTKMPKLVWETKRIKLASGGTRQGVRFGLASPALADGLLYLPDDAGELYAFDAKTGEGQWSAKYGTVSRGAPLVVDGKLYIFDVNAKLGVFKLNGKEPPTILDEVKFRSTTGAGFVETHGTPIAVNGKLYFCTREFTYCIGKADAKASETTAKLAEETAYNETGEAAGIRIYPAEVTASAGQDVTLYAVFVDANGREVRAPADAKVEWTLPPGTPSTPMGPTPLPLAAQLKSEGQVATVTLTKMPVNQQGLIAVKAGKLTATSRMRVAATIPYANDFEKVPEGVAPGGWVNANGKYAVKKLADGSKVLSKVNNDSRPPFARATGYITPTTSSNYSIECDVSGTLVRDQFPDMGVVNSRYLLVLDGKPDAAKDNKRTLRLISWEARLRVNESIEYDWKPDTWYRLKLELDTTDKGVVVKGKVWPKAEQEPTKWSIEYLDPLPNTAGAAGVYGYVTNMKANADGTTTPGSDIHYDNLSIKKK
jgi:outer membrane protein assembly factor BamB